MSNSTRIIVCTVGLALLLTESNLWGQASQSGPIIIGPVSPPPVGGGQYQGPADFVPPAAPLFDPETQCGDHHPETCESCQLPTDDCGESCSTLQFSPSSNEECVGCLGDSDPVQCFQTTGYNLTFGDLRAFCHAEDRCSDEYGRVTVCLNARAACEVHVLESSWINHQVSGGKPLCSPVPVGVCLNGQPLLQPPHSVIAESVGTLGCTDVNVCVSFPRDCLCEAIQRWEDALGLISGPSVHDSQWLFHVGVTKCEDCECE